MSNLAYPLGKQNFAAGVFSWSDAMAAAIISNGYTPNFATDELLTDIPPTALLGVSAPLAAKTENDGVLRASNVTIANLAGGEAMAIVVYDIATLSLFLYIDTSPSLPLSIPPGSSVTIIWDTGANGICAL